MSPTSYQTAPPRDNKNYKVWSMLHVFITDCPHLRKLIQAATRWVQLADYSLKQRSLLHPAILEKYIYKKNNMAEEEGFEPPRGLTRLSVFKTDPFSRTWVFLHLTIVARPKGVEPITF